MRFLILGNGNITSALLGILEGLGESDQWDITVVDIREGISGEEWIREHHGEIDAVVNLTDAVVYPILEACGRYSLGYIDAGFEAEEEGAAYLAAYRKLLASPKNAPHLFGFGMNPGIVELINLKYAPERPYIACEIDTDLAAAESPEVPELFGTWSPRTYAEELVAAPAYVLDREKDLIPVGDAARYNIPLTVGGRTESYCVVPHEELPCFLRGNGNCYGSVFLYRGPSPLQEYLLAGHVGPSKAKMIPTARCLKGAESVGILFYDGSDRLRYVRNRSDHAWAYRFCGHNATCYQTACGVYTAMKLLPLVPRNASMSFTDAAKYLGEEIDAILRKLHFTFEVIDNALDRRAFEERILPLFADAEAVR